MAEAVRAGAEVYAALRRELADRKLSIGSPLSRLRSRVMFAADRTCRAGSWEAASCQQDVLAHRILQTGDQQTTGDQRMTRTGRSLR